MKNKVTALSFGLGLQSESTRTDQIQAHLEEMNRAGWSLLQSEMSIFSIPITWRFYWELHQDRSGRPVIPGGAPE